jgi:hypothetical protein
MLMAETLLTITVSDAPYFLTIINKHGEIVVKHDSYTNITIIYADLLKAAEFSETGLDKILRNLIKNILLGNYQEVQEPL